MVFITIHNQTEHLGRLLLKIVKYIVENQKDRVGGGTGVERLRPYAICLGAFIVSLRQVKTVKTFALFTKYFS